MDAYKIKEVNGRDIFYEPSSGKFYFWWNARKRTSVLLSKIENAIIKLTQQL